MSILKLSFQYLLIVPLLATAGCVSGSDLERLETNQKAILAKLDAKPPARKAPQRKTPPSQVELPVGDAPTKGPDDAPVTIIEVSDFQCPYCKKVVPTLHQIAEAYGDQVRFAFMHNPLGFHPRALPAARAAACADAQGAFWPMHDLLFDNQRQLKDADLHRYAERLGLDAATWQQCTDAGVPDPQIKADQKLVTRLGLRSTPTFVINGRVLLGAQPYEGFKAVIDEELAKAKRR